MDVINVYLSHSSNDAISRLQLLEWLNSHVRKSITRIEEMGNGAIYCFLMHRLFPGFVTLNKVIISPTLEHQKRFNFRILDAAFRKLGVDKKLDIDKLVRGRFHDNLEFLQWFYKFFEVNAQYQLECKEKERKCVSFHLPEEKNCEKKLQRSKTMHLTEPEAVEKPAAEISHLETEGVQKCVEDQEEVKTIDNLANDIDQYELDLLCSGSDAESKELAKDIYKRILTHIETLLEKQCERYYVLRRAFYILSEIGPMVEAKLKFVKLDSDENAADQIDVDV